jgi:hypothetical protein
VATREPICNAQPQPRRARGVERVPAKRARGNRLESLT